MRLKVFVVLALAVLLGACGEQSITDFPDVAGVRHKNNAITVDILAGAGSNVGDDFAKLDKLMLEIAEWQRQQAEGFSEIASMNFRIFYATKDEHGNKINAPLLMVLKSPANDLRGIDFKNTTSIESFVTSLLLHSENLETAIELCVEDYQDWLVSSNKGEVSLCAYALVAVQNWGKTKQ